MFTFGPACRQSNEALAASLDYAFTQTLSPQQVLFGVNYSPANTVSGSPQLARDAFISYLAPEVSTCTFETFADNTLAPFDLPPFSGGAGAVIGTVSGGAKTRLGVIAGRFNTTPGGNSHLQISSSAAIAFSPAISAVGFYGTDFGDFDGSMVVRMRNATTGVTTTHALPAAISGPNGNLLFWGFMSDSETFDQITIATADASTTDLFGIDDLIVATSNQVGAISANPSAAGAAPVVVTFSDTSVGASSRQWDFDNNGVVDSTSPVVAHTYTTPGVYQARLTVTNGGQTSTVLSDPIIVGAVPSASYTAGLQLYWAQTPNVDFFVTSGTPPPLARATWRAACPSGQITDEAFSAYAVSAALPLAVFSGQGALTMTSGAGGVGRTENRVTISGVTAGRFNTTGAVGAPVSGTWWQSAYNFEMTFVAPVRGFSTYITDAGDFGGQLAMVLTDTLGGDTVVPLPTSQLSGSLLFVGFTDDTKQYTKVAFTLTQAPGATDVLGFDDMAVTTGTPIARSSYPIPT